MQVSICKTISLQVHTRLYNFWNDSFSFITILRISFKHSKEFLNNRTVTKPWSISFTGVALFTLNSICSANYEIAFLEITRRNKISHLGYNFCHSSLKPAFLYKASQYSESLAVDIQDILQPNVQYLLLCQPFCVHHQLSQKPFLTDQVG